MQLSKSIVLVPALLIGLAASPCFAQQSPVRGYLIGGGGATVGVSNPNLMLSTEIAEHMGSDLQAYISFVYYDNLISDAAQNDLNAVAASLSAITGTPWVLSGHDRGLSFTVGAKYMIPTGTFVRPYVGGGIGALNLDRSIRELSRGDLTDAFLEQFPRADGVIDITQDSTTLPMTELAAGVGIVIDKAYIDLGYRFRKAYHTLDHPFDMSQVGVSFGVKF